MKKRQRQKQERKDKRGSESEKLKRVKGGKEGKREKGGEKEVNSLPLLSCHSTPEWTAVNWTLITAEK